MATTMDRSEHSTVWLLVQNDVDEEAPPKPEPNPKPKPKPEPNPNPNPNPDQVTGFGGKINLNNTLQSRLDLAYQVRG